MASGRRAVLKTNTLLVPESITSPLSFEVRPRCVVAMQGTKSSTYLPLSANLRQLFDSNDTNSAIKFGAHFSRNQI
jgi:hypothetical protein